MGEPGRCFDAWCIPLLEPSRLEAHPFPGPWGSEPTSSVEPEPLVLRRARLGRDAIVALIDGLRGKGRAELLGRPVTELATSLGAVGERFIEPNDPLRQEALELLPATARVSPPMAEAILDGMARDWTSERLAQLVEVEFGEPTPLDGFVERPPRGRVRAVGPALGLHVSAGSVPGVSVTTMLRSLLVKSAVVVKPGLGDVVLPVLYLRALTEMDPALARAAAVVYWPGRAGGPDEADTAAGDGLLEKELMARADLVVAYGSDESVASVRARLPATTPLVAYHHRVSLAVIGREALDDSTERTAGEVARAVSLFDQRGCVSPQLVFAERGGHHSPAELAEAIAREMDRTAAELPMGPRSPQDAASAQQLRGTARMRSAAGEKVTVWDGDTGSWTVVLDETGEFGGAVPPRTVRVVPVDEVADVLPIARRLAPHLQTVAVAGLGDRSTSFAEALARAGVLRITDLARAPWPPPWWHHDGAGPLTSLVRWIDWEG